MQKLPVLKILVGAFMVPWWDKRNYIKSLALPALLMVSVWVCWLVLDSYDLPLIGWLSAFLYLASFSIFAVTCHRLILVGDQRSIGSYLLSNQFIVVKFLLWSVAVSFLVGLIDTFIMSVVLNVSGSFMGEVVPLSDSGEAMATQNNAKFKLASYIAIIPGLYIMSRLSLVFPSIAIDEPLTMRQSWKCTKNNGFRIFLVVGFFPTVLSVFVGLFLRDEASILEQVAISLLVLLALAIGIFALSLTFKELRNKCKVLTST
ncbi:MAG: hypothetical protein KZQ77_07260 [Candidatus Thiodiazotropha sp. (ex Notomyrtea botanica)]|nr:hypothetical protein [Candidatus Thiodiazotropha sp. (ex Notomyrtea botanica)]